MINVIINVKRYQDSGMENSIVIKGISIPISKSMPKEIISFKANGEKTGKLEIYLKDNSNLIEIVKNIKNAKGLSDDMININGEYEDEQNRQTYKIETVKVENPKGFKDGLFIAYQVGDTTYNYFDRTEIHISQNNNVIGIMRKYEFINKETKANYYYDTINWKGINYYMYQVETASGFAYCIYKEKTLISEYDYKNAKLFKPAAIYAQDNEDTALICILNGIFLYRYVLSEKRENQNSTKHIGGSEKEKEEQNPNDPIPIEAKYIGSVSLFQYDQSIFQNKYDPQFVERQKTK